MKFVKQNLCIMKVYCQELPCIHLKKQITALTAETLSLYHTTDNKMKSLFSFLRDQPSDFQDLLNRGCHNVTYSVTTRRG
jgi:hypothetical protein